MATIVSYLVQFPCNARNSTAPGGMPSSVSTIPHCRKNTSSGGIKCSSVGNTAKHFHPDLWSGHEFSPPSKIDSIPNTLAEGWQRQLKNEVRSLISSPTTNPFQVLDLIDKVQRLGIAYHFESEIKSTLKKIYSDDYVNYFDKNLDDFSTDLYYVSIRFRVLRQAGYYVSPVVFKQFKNGEGDFDIKLTDDIKGMLGLYEASYLGLNGEEIIDEAMAFTVKHLNLILSTGTLSAPLASQVEFALKLPIRKCVERLQARHFIFVYEQDEAANKSLLELARLDYNALQLLHQNEMAEISAWWTGLDLKSKLPFDIRDRVVEGYVMILSFDFRPQFSLGRIHLTKFGFLCSVLDDAHDVYGNMDELRPLCDAFQRWDATSVEGLTEHMRALFDAVLNVFNGMEKYIITRGHYIDARHLKKAAQMYLKGLFDEAKVLYSEGFPTLEKWLSESIFTMLVQLFATYAIMNSTEPATNDVFGWAITWPPIFKYTAIINRLHDDIETLKVEHDRGVNVSSVTCYMNDHGVSESVAIEDLRNIIQCLWKDLNQECLKSNLMHMSVPETAIHLVQIVVLFYNNRDGYSNSKGRTEELITAMLFEPVPV